MTKEQSLDALDKAIDSIEATYEYLLAYAAQGRRTDRDASAEGPRERIGAMVDALDALPGLARTVIETDSPELLAEAGAFFGALDRDAAVAAAAARLVLAQADISSQLVDNLNASIHLRALLTDIFLLDEIVGKRS